MIRDGARYIDTHCHLFWDSFREDLADVIRRANAAGVEAMLIPSTNVDTLARSLEIADSNDRLFVAAGIHPQDGAVLPSDYLTRIREAARNPKVVAIGEIGLDYYWDTCPKETQRTILHEQLELAADLQLPVILHNRDSSDDLVSIIRSHQDGSLRGQFHCFGGTLEFARQVLDLGFHVSFTGNVTYRKANLDALVTYIPEERLLLETDAPFMPPVPFRGKRNEPAYLPHTAEQIARIREREITHIARVTHDNAVRLFSLNNL